MRYLKSEKSSESKKIAVLSLALVLSSVLFSSSSFGDSQLDSASRAAIVAWTSAKANGQTDLVAAQAANAARMTLSSEPKYGSFEKGILKNAKKYVDGWNKAKKLKLSDSAATKSSGFTPQAGKSGDIYIFKQGITAWNTAKRSKKSDDIASKSFARAVWDATISIAAISMTDDASVQKIKSEAEIWNAENNKP